jgi:hypothetical protein
MFELFSVKLEDTKEGDAEMRTRKESHHRI